MHFPWAHPGAARLWVCRTRAHELPQQHGRGAQPSALAVHRDTWEHSQSCAHTHWHSQRFLGSSWLLGCHSFNGKLFLFLRWAGLPWWSGGHWLQGAQRVPARSHCSSSATSCLLCHPGRPELLSSNHPSPQLWHKWLKCWNRNPGKDRIHHSAGILCAV